MITSDGYGGSKDPESKILESTDNAVLVLLAKMSVKGMTEVHTPKINSGLFGVPWEKTEKIILQQLKGFPNINWTVWSL